MSQPEATGPTEPTEPTGPTEPVPDHDGGFRRLSPLTPLARSAIFFVAAAYAGGRQLLQDREFTGLAIAAFVVLVVGGGFGFASWYRTRFRITATELRIDTGVLNRRSRRVRLDRVLEIGVNQPAIARLLGLAELKIETATTESEVSLAYLPLREAHEVRQVLLDHRSQVRHAEGLDGTAGTGGPDNTDSTDSTGVLVAPGPPAPPVEPVLLVQVPVRWQLIGLVASGETLALVLVALVVLGLLVAGIPIGALGIGFISVLGTGVSLARKVVDWWDWKVSAVPTGLQVRHGMFGIQTRTFNVERLQGVRISEPLLQRPFGLARLDLSVAGGGIKDSGEDGTGVALPVAPRHLVWQLASDLIGADPSLVVLTPPPSRARWLRPVTRSWLGFGMDERLVVSRTGWFNRRTDLVPLARVQSLRAVQGPVQRLLRLASVFADCPAGLVQPAGPDRDPDEVRMLVAVGAERARVARMPSGSVPATLDADPDSPGKGL